MLTQTTGRWEHLRLLDEARHGCAATMNTLAEQARGEWLLPLADDDLILPRCVETLFAHSADADVVYAPPMVWGLPPQASAHFFAEPPFIPSFALINKTLWRQLDGYDYDWNREEDRRFYIRALDRGARFVRADSEPTWVYRHHGGNKSYHNGVAS